MQTTYQGREAEDGAIVKPLALGLDQAAAHQATGNVQLVHSKRVTVLVRNNQVPRCRATIASTLPFNDLHVSRVGILVFVRVMLLPLQ